MRNVVRIHTELGGCSGTLIAPQLVLFAAHCVDGIQPGCARVTFDQDYDPSYGGYRVKIPPVGSANMDDPNVQLVRIDGIRIHPAYSRSDAAASCCAGGDPDGREECMDSVEPSKPHDMAVAHLEEPLSIEPAPVLLRLGPRLPSLGRYPVSPANLIGETAVVAGTSSTTQHPSGGYRAYAAPTIYSTTMQDDVTVVTGSGCVHPLETETSGAGAIRLNSDPTGGCVVQGDSGGPTFLNWTSLGGSAISGLQSGDILVAGVHWGGAALGTTTCEPGETTGSHEGLVGARSDVSRGQVQA